MTQSGLTSSFFHSNYFRRRTKDAIAERRAKCKGLTQREENTPALVPPSWKFPPRNPAKKRAKRRELPFCCVVRRVQCPSRINANTDLTKEGEEKKRRKRERESKRSCEIKEEGSTRWGSMVEQLVSKRSRFLIPILSSVLSNSNRDTSAHHFTCPTFSSRSSLLPLLMGWIHLR